MNGQFDSHLYEVQREIFNYRDKKTSLQGRHAQMVLSKLGGKSIGESSVEITRIAEVARVSISMFY